ncbi:alpha/beta hydrolase [Actinopolymorpha pittospori]|uniref:alpha/beta hydrolase n=1 Tax=Actinopolymorpha pittospori TaxID=648752 RepID=UPI001789071C
MRSLLTSILLASVVMATGTGADALATPDTRPALPPLRYAAQVVDGHELLAYDAEGDGRIVEVLGDLRHADHIAVLVPGAGHSLDTYFSGRAGGTPRQSGLALLAELRRQAPHEQVAVVVWLGYDTPEGVDAASARSDRARPGARDLARLTHQLPAAARITLVGHSYGSVVIGQAAPAARADDIVVVGSPGLDAAVEADLRTGATVWAARAPGDPIRFAPPVRIAGWGHGAAPTSSSFGARSFAVGDIRGHSSYFTPGSESLSNIARIVRGRPDEVTGPTPRTPRPETTVTMPVASVAAAPKGAI